MTDFDEIVSRLSDDLKISNIRDFREAEYFQAKRAWYSLLALVSLSLTIPAVITAWVAAIRYLW